MKWKIEDLQEKIALLEHKVALVTDELQKYSLLQDLHSLKTMVNYSSKKIIYPINNLEINRCFIDEDYLKDMIDLLNGKFKDIEISLNNLIHLNKIPWKYTLSKRLNIYEDEELLKEFLKSFDNRLLDLYIDYKNQNRIEFNKKEYENSNTCLGKCYYIFSEGKSYISVRDRENITNFLVLAHELSHAIQFQNRNNEIVVQNMITSLFSEAYPIFVEYAFLEFLKTTKYKKIAYMQEGINLDNFLCTLEYGFSVLNTKVDTTTFYKNRSIYTLMISHFIALSWLNLYRINSKDAQDKINEFNVNFGKDLVSEYFKENSSKEIASSVTSEVGYYLSRYRKK